MKRFRFPLRPVAVIRAHREMCAREALAAATEVHARAEERVSAAGVRLAELESVIRAGRNGHFRAADGAVFSQAYRREWAVEAEAQKQRGAARLAMEKRREACIEANRQLKVITRLEDKARTQHEQDRQRAEQGELDEIASQRAARRRHSSP